MDRGDPRFRGDDGGFETFCDYSCECSTSRPSNRASHDYKDKQLIMIKTKKQLIGEWGEQEAVRFLVEKGYRIIARNFRTRQGEIDIIARHNKPHFGETLCFVEVKTRGGEKGSAERATRGEKFGRIQKAAQAYCLENNIDIERSPIQFEQVSIYGGPKGLKDIRHYEIPLL